MLEIQGGGIRYGSNEQQYNSIIGKYAESNISRVGQNHIFTAGMT
jgi:hypothetical protein